MKIPNSGFTASSFLTGINYKSNKRKDFSENLTEEYIKLIRGIATSNSKIPIYNQDQLTKDLNNSPCPYKKVHPFYDGSARRQSFSASNKRYKNNNNNNKRNCSSSISRHLYNLRKLRSDPPLPNRYESPFTMQRCSSLKYTIPKSKRFTDYPENIPTHQFYTSHSHFFPPYSSYYNIPSNKINSKFVRSKSSMGLGMTTSQRRNPKEPPFKNPVAPNQYFIDREIDNIRKNKKFTIKSNREIYREIKSAVPGPGSYFKDNFNNCVYKDIKVSLRSRREIFCSDELKRVNKDVCAVTYKPKYNFVDDRRFDGQRFGKEKRFVDSISRKGRLYFSVGVDGTPGPGYYNVPSSFSYAGKKLPIN